MGGIQVRPQKVASHPWCPQPTGVRESQLSTIDSGPPRSHGEKPLPWGPWSWSTTRGGPQLPGNAWRS